MPHALQSGVQNVDGGARRGVLDRVGFGLPATIGTLAEVVGSNHRIAPGGEAVDVKKGFLRVDVLLHFIARLCRKIEVGRHLSEREDSAMLPGHDWKRPFCPRGQGQKPADLQGLAGLGHLGEGGDAVELDIICRRMPGRVVAGQHIVFVEDGVGARSQFIKARTRQRGLAFNDRRLGGCGQCPTADGGRCGSCRAQKQTATVEQEGGGGERAGAGGQGHVRRSLLLATSGRSGE